MRPISLLFGFLCFFMVSCDQGSDFDPDCALIDLFCGDILRMELTRNGGNFLDQQPDALIRITQNGFNVLAEIEQGRNQLTLILFDDSPLMFEINGTSFEVDITASLTEAECCGAVIQVEMLELQGLTLCDGSADCDEVVEVPLNGIFF